MRTLHVYTCCRLQMETTTFALTHKHTQMHGVCGFETAQRCICVAGCLCGPLYSFTHTPMCIRTLPDISPLGKEIERLTIEPLSVWRSETALMIRRTHAHTHSSAYYDTASSVDLYIQGSRKAHLLKYTHTHTPIWLDRSDSGIR